MSLRWTMVMCVVTLSLLTPLPCLRHLHSDIASGTVNNDSVIVIDLRQKLAEVQKKLLAAEAIAELSEPKNEIEHLSCKFPYYDKTWQYSCSPEGTCPYELDLQTGAALKHMACPKGKPPTPKLNISVLDDNLKTVLKQIKSSQNSINFPTGNTKSNSSDIQSYVNSYKSFLQSLPSWKSVSKQFTAEAGIMFFAGGERLLSALTTALYIKTVLKSVLPIEIWRDSSKSEGKPTLEMIKIAEAHDIVFRVIPREYGVRLYTWDDQWVNPDGVAILSPNSIWMSMKPMAILASRFETVIFFDDDAIPIVKPETLLTFIKEDPTITAVFWRDVWAMFSESSIWEHLDLKVKHPFPSQDSGVLLIKKSTSWEALALSVFFNINHKIYYPLIYYDRITAHTAFGTGDKDTFQMAWMATGKKYHLMPPLSMVGAHRWRCGPTLGQPGYKTPVAILHMNSFKLRFADFTSGKWKRWFDVRPKAGFALQSVYSLNENEAANQYDGKNHDQIKWSGVRKSGAARCLKWVARFSEESLENIAGRDVGLEIRSFYERVFSSPWAPNFLSELPGIK